MTDPAPPAGHPDLLLANATLAGGSTVDVLINDGVIVSVQTAGSRQPDGTRTVAVESRDLTGWLLLPALTEPHAHLDKTLTADLVPNPTGDLAGAIRGWLDYRAGMDADDVLHRARTALHRSVQAGITTLRSHVDTGPDVSLAAVEALVELRGEVRGLVDLQIVAGYGLPATGPQAADSRARMRDAVALGIIAVGGAPSLDDDPVAALHTIADFAAAHRLPLDLHIDETLDPGVFLLPEVVRIAEQSDLPVTVGHIVSLAAQPEQVRRATSQALAAAGIGVVTLPQSNLFLQGRGGGPLAPRGLTAIDDLYLAGVAVGVGSDNVADPFNPVGRGDPLESASLLISAGHRSPAEALGAITDQARRAIGLTPSTIAADEPADLLAVRADGVLDAIGRAPADRLVFRGGCLIAQTLIDHCQFEPIPAQPTTTAPATR